MQRNEGLMSPCYLISLSLSRPLTPRIQALRMFRAFVQSSMWGLTVRPKRMTKGMLNWRGVVVIVFVSRQISSWNRRTTNPVGFAFRIQGLLEGRKHINWMLNRNFEFVEMEGIPIYVHIGVTSQSASLDELGH